ncbi:MAG TPA: M28 family peptidase [Rubrobacteraceae bacterium]
MRNLSDTEKEIVEAVSPERLMTDIEAIARWTRLSGTQEERESFDYVEGVLHDLGLQTTHHAGWAYISLPEGAELSVEGAEVPAITHSMVPQTPEGGLELPLVYVGQGTPEDYAAKDVRSKAVLAEGIAIPGKAQAAEDAGAAACIFANADEHVHEMIVSTVWGSPTSETRAELPRIPVASVNVAGGEMLREALGENDSPTVRLRTRVCTRWTEIPTLTVQVDGAEEPERFVLLSGHIDSWHHGAMDNGSANALMLETLRVLLSQRETFRRSLRVAFWSGHSHGRYAGSTWYADNFWEDLHDNCVLHLNADSTGGRGATVVTEGQAMAETRGVAVDVVRALTGEEFNGSRFGRSGDQSFMSLGVPSLFMFVSEQPPGQDESAGDVAELLGGPGAKGGGVGWWWHTTEDTVDKIDPDLLVRDTRIFAAATYRFLSEAVLLLDVRASAEELLAHFEGWRDRAQGRFDLSAAVSRARGVADLAGDLQTRLEAAGDEMEVARGFNEAVRRAESGLVRLNYVESDLYGQDPALGQPPVPLLLPIDDLLLSEPGSDADHENATLLVRRRNRILHELSEVERALRDGLALLSSGPVASPRGGGESIG